MMIFLWALLLVLLVAVVRWAVYSKSSKSGENSTKSALEILEERYAKGEISKAEFESKKRKIHL